MVAKNGNITDLLEGLAKKTNLETDALSNLRVYDVQAYRLIRTLPAEHPVLSLNEHSPIYAEKIPEDELAEEQPHHIHAFHFEKETNKTHSIPFIFLLKEVCMSAIFGTNEADETRVSFSKRRRNASRNVRV